MTLIVRSLWLVWHRGASNVPLELPLHRTTATTRAIAYLDYSWQRSSKTASRSTMTRFLDTAVAIMTVVVRTNVPVTV